MQITADQLTQQLALARNRGWAPFMTKAERRHKLPAGLLLAIASRETNMQDIVGDVGHGRGLFQIDDRSHGDWLAQHGATGPGTTPDLRDAADYAASLLGSNLDFARQNGVSAEVQIKFACSAYNAGQGGALSGFKRGDSDKNTTGGDYGSDVLERLAAIQSGDGAGGQGSDVLEKGARGPQVAKLKRQLKAWYDRQAPGLWQSFKVAPGPLFGAALVAAVEDFQIRNGIEVDGQVGAATLKALTGGSAPVPKPAPQPKPAPSGVLEQGSRGPEVAKLKKALQAWYDHAAPGVWDTFHVAGGPGFGPALDHAVRDFQQRNGLVVDGQVGDDTRNAIEGTPPPGPAPKPAPSQYPDLTLPSPQRRGSKNTQAVKLVQGWLCLHNLKVVVDGGFGKATAFQVVAFQKANGLRVTGVVDDATYAALVRPMVAALTPLAGAKPLGQLTVAYARQHLAQHPLEIGGENCGPWVRLYTGGFEGVNYPWCAAFATFCHQQACTTLGVAPPIPHTVSCDDMSRHAGARFLPQPAPSQRARITPGSFFLRLAPQGEKRFKYAHTGIVVHADADTFATIEGNTNDDGSAEGYEVCARVRGYDGMDFIVM